MTNPLGLVSIVLPVTPVVLLVVHTLGLGLAILGPNEHPLGLLLLSVVASTIVAGPFWSLLHRFEFRLEGNDLVVLLGSLHKLTFLEFLVFFFDFVHEVGRRQYCARIVRVL